MNDNGVKAAEESKPADKCLNGEEHTIVDHWARRGFHDIYEGRFCSKCGEIFYNAVGNLH